MRTGHEAEFLGECEDGQKVWDRQEECPLLVEPAGRRGILTLRAMSVLSGHWTGAVPVSWP
jgi:hypothetical protein